MPIIEIRNLSYVYHPNTPYEKKALDDISFTVGKGEFLGIVGSNGSGKSTLIQHFNGLIYPELGSILVSGQDTRDKDFREQLWKKVGLVFQFPEKQLFEATVFDELAYGLKNMGLAAAEIEMRVDEALKSVGLEPEQSRKRSPFSLSGGMMRRVAVASVLAMKPDILVLDEPTAGLDPEGSSHILQAIKKFQQDKGVTVILVSHCIDDLILLADRLAVLDQGKLLAWGLTRDVLAQENLAQYDRLLPDYLKMLFDLKKRGWVINTGLLTVEEACQEIAKILRRDGT
jgi:energy-coupling factor transport system ATP-binding protein